MLVYCFTIKQPTGNTNDIELVYKDFGENIPNYCMYEGCTTGCVYLCCVDIRVNIGAICNKYGYEYDRTRFCKIEIPDEMYNNEYDVHPVYADPNQRFGLSLNRSSRLC